MLNLSGVSVGGQARRYSDQQHAHGHMQPPYQHGAAPAAQQHHQAPTFPDVSSVAPTMSGGATAGSSPSAGASEVLFDDEVPVLLKNMEREEVCQELGVCVQLTKNGPYRAVHLRVTDPKDPFFLYTMALSEDDYGRFKESNELAVDFAGFPRDLVAMLASAQALPSAHMMGVHQQQQQQQQHQHQHHNPADTSTMSTSVGGPTIVTFTISNTVDATLRVLERTAFRKVEHLSLKTVRQGDVGQKQHLAERFRHFFRAFHSSEHQRRAEYERMSKQIGDLSAGLELARAELDALRQTGAVQASEAKLALSNTTERMRESHDEQLRTLQAERDAQVEALKREAAAEARRAQADLAQAQQRHEAGAKRVQELEGERLRLSTELAQKTELLAAALHDKAQLAERVDELAAFQRRATHEKTEMEKLAVASEERLKHLADLLRVRDEETSQLRRQTDSAEGNLRRSNEQLDATRKRLDETETSLAKAHHIITTHLATLKSKQEKIKGMEVALAAADRRVSEKEMDVERIRLETAADRDKCATLTARCTELKEQLQRAEEQNTTLATDLKQSQDALMHLGRSASSMPNRTWSSHTGAGAGATSMSMAGGGAAGAGGANMSATLGQHHPLSSSSFAPAPISLYREFARGAAADTSSASAAAAAGGGLGQYSSAALGGGYGSRPPFSSAGASAYGASATPSMRTPGSGGGVGAVGGGSSDFKSMLRSTATSGATPGAASAYFPA